MKKSSAVSLEIISACVLLIGFAIFSLISSNKKKSQSTFGMQKGGADTVISVRTQEAKVSTLHDYVNTNGEIRPETSVDVFPEIGGRIVKVNVALGSNVKKGEVIAEVDPSSPGAQYANSPVYAPISGTVTSTPLKLGTKVSVQSPVTTIGDVQTLQIKASIPERYVAALKTGLKANIVLVSFPDVVINATVTHVSPVVDQTSRTKEVILDFDRKDSRINAGMFAKVKLFTYDYAGCITVPENAVIDKNGQPCVYVVEEKEVEVKTEEKESVPQESESAPAEKENTIQQVVRLVKVETGNTVDNVIQIKSGVNVGERIVVEGMRVLSDGAVVKDISK